MHSASSLDENRVEELATLPRLAGVDTATIEEAKEVYETLASVPGVGPFAVIDEPSERDVMALQGQIKSVISDVVWIGKRKRVAWAPSPWHTAVFAATVAEYSAWSPLDLGDELATAGRILFGQTVRQRPLFRGHPDSDWRENLTPRRARRGIDRKSEDRAASLVCDFLDTVWRSTDLPLAKGVHMATAQHYGLHTKLLDLTPDPAVAVFFGASGERRRKDQRAVLFVLPHIDALLYHKARVILPPPFVQRLHHQYGVFLELGKRRRVRSARRACWQILFPLDESFRVRRDGEPVDVHPEDEWFEKVIAWARHAADTSKAAGDQRVSLLSEAVATMGVPPSTSSEQADRLLQDWLYFLFTMLCWLAIRLHPPGNVIDVSVDVLAAVDRDNPSLIDLMLERRDELMKRLVFKAEGPIADALLKGLDHLRASA